ncbi:hypothetical protein GQ600_14109 [Phytophthora cactorum]|nr:hypothetical protein GQ600_14109 [Phytophthora cactorum]
MADAASETICVLAPLDPDPFEPEVEVDWSPTSVVLPPEPLSEPSTVLVSVVSLPLATPEVSLVSPVVSVGEFVVVGAVVVPVAGLLSFR